jgi:N-methylhydantoinase A
MLRHARIRYEWQRHELEINVPDALDAGAVAEVTSTFEQSYESRYGSAALLPEAKLELVSVRVEAVAPTGVRAAGRMANVTTDALEKPPRQTTFERGVAPRETPVYDGGAIGTGEPIIGPAVIDLPTTGIVVPPGTTVVRSDGGDFIMTFGS